MRKILFIVFFSLILLQQTFGMQLVVPPKGHAYVGAYVDFGKDEDNVTLEGLEKFECLVGKHQAVIGFSNYWGKQEFPSSDMGEAKTLFESQYNAVVYKIKAIEENLIIAENYCGQKPCIKPLCKYCLRNKRWIL